MLLDHELRRLKLGAVDRPTRNQIVSSECLSGDLVGLGLCRARIPKEILQLKRKRDERPGGSGVPEPRRAGSREPGFPPPRAAPSLPRSHMLSAIFSTEFCQLSPL